VSSTKNKLMEDKDDIFNKTGPALLAHVLTGETLVYLTRIHDKLRMKYPSGRQDPAYIPTLQQCLSDVRTWAPDLRAASIDALLKRHDYLPACYADTYSAVLDLQSARRLPDHRMPPFAEFYVLFLAEMPDDPCVLGVDVTGANALHDLSLCVRNMVRRLMLQFIKFSGDSLTTNNLRVIQASLATPEAMAPPDSVKAPSSARLRTPAPKRAILPATAPAAIVTAPALLRSPKAPHTPPATLKERTPWFAPGVENKETRAPMRPGTPHPATWTPKTFSSLSQATSSIRLND
jgi:hypothetical protein